MLRLTKPVAELVDHDAVFGVVITEQGRFHRSGRNVKCLHHEGAKDQQADGQRKETRFCGLGPSLGGL